MKYSEAKPGRVFVIRLEKDEVVHEVIEQFAKEKHIQAVSLIIVGGADSGTKLVVGPAEGNISPNELLTHHLMGVHEITGTGTVFPNHKNEPVLHLHMACGRGSMTICGCVRTGVKAWHVMEIILTELLDTSAKRELDPNTGFELLQP